MDPQPPWHSQAGWCTFREEEQEGLRYLVVSQSVYIVSSSFSERRCLRKICKVVKKTSNVILSPPYSHTKMSELTHTIYKAPHTNKNFRVIVHR